MSSMKNTPVVGAVRPAFFACVVALSLLVCTSHAKFFYGNKNIEITIEKWNATSQYHNFTIKALNSEGWAALGLGSSMDSAEVFSLERKPDSWTFNTRFSKGPADVPLDSNLKSALVNITGPTSKSNPVVTFARSIRPKASSIADATTSKSTASAQVVNFIWASNSQSFTDYSKTRHGKDAGHFAIDLATEKFVESDPGAVAKVVPDGTPVGSSSVSDSTSSTTDKSTTTSNSAGLSVAGITGIDVIAFSMLAAGFLAMSF